MVLLVDIFQSNVLEIYLNQLSLFCKLLEIVYIIFFLILLFIRFILNVFILESE